MRILIVEDDPRVGSFAKRALESIGSTVDLATSVPEALDLLTEPDRAYHVVVVDRCLPGGSGDEVAQEVASLCPDSGIVLTSGLSRTGRPFYDVWLDKPFGVDELVGAVSDALIARSLRRYGKARRSTSVSGLRS